MKKYTKPLRILRKIIGRNIHELRMERGFTLKKLSRHTNINPLKIDQYEMGKNEITLDKLFKIADALGVDIIDLLE